MSQPAFTEPKLGSTFRDFIVTEYFLDWWRVEADKLKQKQQASRRSETRYARMRDRNVVTDALWLTLDNVSAAARLLGIDNETILRHRDESKRKRSVLYTTPAQCHVAVMEHGTWEKARLALGIKTKRAFIRRIQEWHEEQAKHQQRTE